MTTTESYRRVNLLESLLFVAPGPTDRAQLARILELTTAELDETLAALEQRYTDRGLHLQYGKRGTTVQLVTIPEAASYVERFLGLEVSGKLSPAALETLAIVMYRQPITRAEIEAIRGVNCDGVLRTLMSRELIAEVDRLDTPGRPIRYGASHEALQYFGLRGEGDLPPLSTDEDEHPTAPAPYSFEED